MELKANFGQGDIFLIPITDSGESNETSNVYSLEALYAQDFYRWEGKRFDADKAGYMPHSLFFETGLLGGYGDQKINTLHTWGADVTMDQQRNGVFLGVKAGIGYKYNFRNELIVNFVPVAVSVSYINIWSSWEHGFPRSGLELLAYDW